MLKLILPSHGINLLGIVIRIAILKRIFQSRYFQLKNAFFIRRGHKT